MTRWDPVAREWLIDRADLPPLRPEMFTEPWRRVDFQAPPDQPDQQQGDQ